MTRARAFCRFCGGLTTRKPDADGLYRCAAHADLRLEHEAMPADPAGQMLTTAAQLGEAVQSTRERGH